MTHQPQSFEQRFRPFLRRLAFGLLGLTTLLLALATFVEHGQGTATAQRLIYYSPATYALWTLLGLSAAAWLWLCRHGLKQRWSLWLIHGALGLILLGAGISAASSKGGTMHLRLGTPEPAYADDSPQHLLRRLPFTVSLESFEVINHAGTTVASDYVSLLKSEGYEYRVSMNRVATIKGYRFYQLSYDEDLRGTRLLVRYDPWGRLVSFTGYGLLFLALLLNLVLPHGGLRHAWRRAQRLGAMTLLLLPTFSPMRAAQPGTAIDAPRTLPEAQAEAFGRLHVSHGGRIASMRTLSQDFLRKLCGRPDWDGYSAEQVVVGWILYPEDWNRQPIVQVKSRALRQALHLPAEASFSDFFSPGYRLGPLLSVGEGNDPARAGLRQAALDVDDCLQLVYDLRRGALLKLFPVGTPPQWISPTTVIPAGSGMAPTDSLLLVDGFTALNRAAQRGDTAGVAKVIDSIARYQRAHGGETLPPTSVVRAEKMLTAFDVPFRLSHFLLAIGLSLFVWSLQRPTAPGRTMYRLVATLLSGAWVWLTAYAALLSVVTGRLPLGNGFETMLTASWLSLSVGLCAIRLLRRVPLLAAMPFLGAGFFLLVASLSQSSAPVGKLVPVLNSPLLSAHVSTIMLAYALLAFTFFIGLTALLRRKQAPLLQQYSLLLLYPGVALLAVGIFIGALWADSSWGRYWGWDAKEVWALITLFVYVAPLHSGSLSRFRRPLFFHAYLLLAFSTVLMTYFGVNFLLGGMHSYAG